MADMFSKEKRSEIMASIRSKNSKAERLVYSYLRKEGVYHQRHYKKATGTPDIALPRKKKAVFIDGDFWHGRGLDELVRLEKISQYWENKIRKNIERDEVQRASLKEQGWSVLVVWESDINRKSTREQALNDIINFLAGVR